MPTKKKYPIIGGELDGEAADYADFYDQSGVPGQQFFRPAGEFHVFRSDYVAFNCASRHRDAPSMIWLHVTLLRPTVRA